MRADRLRRPAGAVVAGEIDGTLIAVARFDRHQGTTEAEVAFVVADEYQHHGIGSLLLDQLVFAARARGITTFLADALSESNTMLGVFLHAGFEVQTNAVLALSPCASTSRRPGPTARLWPTGSNPAGSPQSPLLRGRRSPRMLIVAGPAGGMRPRWWWAARPDSKAGSSGHRRYHNLDFDDEIEFVTTPKAELEDLARVHSAKYLADLEAFCNQGGGDLDPDTYARSDSFSAARRAAGAGLEAIAALERRRPRELPSYRCDRPGAPGAEQGAMGFCLLNSIAVPAAASLTAKGHRVLIIDWDVHHGNGTQSIFWDDPNVLYVSTHQWPLFPGTGGPKRSGDPMLSGSP